MCVTPQTLSRGEGVEWSGFEAIEDDGEVWEPWETSKVIDSMIMVMVMYSSC